MKIYFAGADSRLGLIPNFESENLLIAYPYLKQKKVVPLKHWFLDSGAYSVFTGTFKINLEQMIEDYKTYRMDIKAGLDVIGSAEQTKRNCLLMKQHGLDIIPTFHFGEDWEYLKFYAENFNYVALGGVAQLRGQKERLHEWLQGCFYILKDYILKKHLKVHGFAIGSPELLTMYPFYSVDMTSWLQSSMYGDISELKGFKMKRAVGVHMKKPLHYLERDVYAIQQYKKLQNTITKLWESRGLIWK